MSWGYGPGGGDFDLEAEKNHEERKDVEAFRRERESVDVEAMGEYDVYVAEVGEEEDVGGEGVPSVTEDGLPTWLAYEEPVEEKWGGRADANNTAAYPEVMNEIFQPRAWLGMVE
ncbi:hypothetical protein DXG01_015520 [Tephrocybe rancida]|nr:hypothetical protein DXG01_015520 [Tephrocybe rancida]